MTCVCAGTEGRVLRGEEEEQEEDQQLRVNAPPALQGGTARRRLTRVEMNLSLIHI